MTKILLFLFQSNDSNLKILVSGNDQLEKYNALIQLIKCLTQFLGDISPTDFWLGVGAIRPPL